jgi:hypothetical protein
VRQLQIRKQRVSDIYASVLLIWFVYKRGDKKHLDQKQKKINFNDFFKQKRGNKKTFSFF